MNVIEAKKRSVVNKPSRGVFWVVDGEFFAFPFTDENAEGVSKSGNTYNHKKLWSIVKPKGCSYTYNYYPRGRVEISSKGKPVIYVNPNIEESVILQIVKEFGLLTELEIKHDHSEHYKCYTDDGWEADC